MSRRGGVLLGDVNWAFRGEPFADRAEFPVASKLSPLRFLFVALLAATALPSAAQDFALTQPTVGILSSSPTIDSERARISCPSFLTGHRDQLEAEVPEDSSRSTCSVVRVDSLGDAAGLRWWAVKYLTRYVFPADSIKRQYAPRDTTDTADVLDVVVYSVQRGATAWRAQWQGWAERRMTRDVDVTLGVHGTLAVFSILSCVNGTGGCDQHFLGRTASTWVPLNERYHAQLERRFGRDVFWKGVVVDVHTLRGTVPLYSGGDANCCASRQLRLTLVVRGTDVAVGSADP